MYKTEFHEFADKLSVIFQGEQSPEDFTKGLFVEIYLPDSDNDPVEDTLPRTYKGYFYGEHDITSLAKRIAGSLDTENFKNFITIESDDAIETLCESFKNRCPGITKKNYNTKIAARFKEIVESAAKTKKKSKNTVKAVTATNTKTLEEKYGVFLVAEAGSICPQDGCTKSLFVRENGRLGMVYKVAIIDTGEDADNTDNLIAMCPDCAHRYEIGYSDISIQRVKQIKKSLLEAYEDREIISEQKVQDGVRRVLEKIPTMKRPNDIDLNYDPVPVRRKIEPDNETLYLKVQSHVNVYYKMVHETFQEICSEGKLRFEPFCLQVRSNYLNLKDRGHDQKKIYYEMTKWLKEATNEEWDSCEIVISYFIQKCEVFDVTPE